MNDFIEDFSKSLETGFIDKLTLSEQEYQPQFLVNDKIIGTKVLSTIQKELLRCEEFWFSVAFITKSGVATLINTFKELEDKGVKGKLLVSQYLNFTQPEALKTLLKFKNIESKIVINENFHSKGYLFKKQKHYNLIVGSSNLTANALCTNTEWNLKISATPQSYIIGKTINEFSSEFTNATIVNDNFIQKYNLIYKESHKKRLALNSNSGITHKIPIEPNLMQQKALENLIDLRENKISKALLISATGTGKTYLSAFDIKNCKPKKVLYVVHRRNIANKAMQTYKTVFGFSKKMGLFSGTNKSPNADFVFSTVQTISKRENLNIFDKNHFDYIIIDETHRAGAESYNRILEYFKPAFLLGMTATPERTDGFDIFNLFDYNIAYEIRLHAAMEENMLTPFHYYGVTDISVNGEVLNENTDFRLLTAKERVERIVEKAEFYGCDDGEVRGLVFCSKIEESKSLSEEFNTKGYKTISLSGSNTEEEREEAITRLESNVSDNKIDYIFTVDIFNEGIDIPRVNQIIMLRPTQSAIIFVQQLGRGLRKLENKEFLTVIDFIGNYEKNYLVPVALYGDTSYNKDTLRKLMASGNNYIPGSSTVNFDKISRERIYAAIDSANMQLKRDLVKDYQLLKYKLGHMPMMIDFLNHGSRDPQLYVNYSNSYFNFVLEQEDHLKNELNDDEIKLLEYFSKEINNSKRIEECLILKKLIENKFLKIETFKKCIADEYNYNVSGETVASCVKNLNFEFVTQRLQNRLVNVRQIFNYNIVKIEGDSIIALETLNMALENSMFCQFLFDGLSYSIQSFDKAYKKSKFCDGFILYNKYSRKDVFRILNWDQNPMAQNVGGYIVSKDKSNCPIFVNYHKDESISDTTKYEDRFINNVKFSWMSKSRRTLNSPEIILIRNCKSELRLPLFVKKSNDEGTEFYYMGDLTPIEDSFEQTTMTNGNNTNVSVVKVDFNLNHPVEETIYSYITNNYISNNKEIVDIKKTETQVSINLPEIISFPKKEEQYISCVPFYSLKATAGKFDKDQFTDDSNSHHEEWVKIIDQKLEKDMFAIRVVGKSMEPMINDGDYCLFRAGGALGGTRQGKIVLVQHRSIIDPETNTQLTVKKYQSEKKYDDNGNPIHISIILKPLNSDYEPIVIEQVLHDDEFRIIAEFVTVIR